MAALTATIPVNAGVVSGIAGAGAAVAASDTIAESVMGKHGVYLEIINANASPDTVTISDAGTTKAGNALAGGTISKAVANATAQIFKIRREQVNPTTRLVTVTHSVTATVTYKMYPF